MWPDSLPSPQARASVQPRRDTTRSSLRQPFTDYYPQELSGFGPCKINDLAGRACFLSEGKPLKDGGKSPTRWQGKSMTRCRILERQQRGGRGLGVEIAGASARAHKKIAKQKPERRSRSRNPRRRRANRLHIRAQLACQNVIVSRDPLELRPDLGVDVTFGEGAESRSRLAKQLGASGSAVESHITKF